MIAWTSPRGTVRLKPRIISRSAMATCKFLIVKACINRTEKIRSSSDFANQIWVFLRPGGTVPGGDVGIHAIIRRLTKYRANQSCWAYRLLIFLEKVPEYVQRREVQTGHLFFRSDQRAQ